MPVNVMPPGTTKTNELQPLKSLFSHIYKFLNSSKVYILIFSRGIQLGTPQASKMTSFATVINGFKLLTITAKSSILDVYGALGYASILHNLVPPRSLFSAMRMVHSYRKTSCIAGDNDFVQNISQNVIGNAFRLNKIMYAQRLPSWLL